MHFFSTTKFELTGTFAGFFRNHEGKRRMRLRIGTSEEIVLKLPKSLRKTFESRLTHGISLAVLGVEYRDIAGESKYVVSYLRVLSPTPEATPDACTKCSIRVCAKKNCWKNGGDELFEQLRARVSELGLQDVVNVKAVSCLDNCKHGPNAECGKKLYERCDSHSADEIIERATQRVRKHAIS